MGSVGDRRWWLTPIRSTGSLTTPVVVTSGSSGAQPTPTWVIAGGDVDHLCLGAGRYSIFPRTLLAPAHYRDGD
jgi:hypothetical protein